jgi:hypothetical protein
MVGTIVSTNFMLQLFMKNEITQIEHLRTILAACKVVGVDGVVLSEGMARGAKASKDAAIISRSLVDIPTNVKLGIGRVAELEKRLSIFGDTATIEYKTNDNDDITVLNIISGKTKMMFRCTSAGLMKYPKANNDPAYAQVKLNRAEAALLTKSIKTLSAELVVLHSNKSGLVRIEGKDSTNDKFEIELASQAIFVDEEDSFVQSYLAPLFCDAIDACARDNESIDLTIGESGSITIKVKGHDMVIIPQIGEDED